jgi:hypothetical protein
MSRFILLVFSLHCSSIYNRIGWTFNSVKSIDAFLLRYWHCQTISSIVVYSCFLDVVLSQPKQWRVAYTLCYMDKLTLKVITKFYAFVENMLKVHCLNTPFPVFFPWTLLVDIYMFSHVFSTLFVVHTFYLCNGCHSFFWWRKTI